VLPGGENFECPQNKPTLDAAHAADILISYSCRGGLCGSCKGRVIAGEIVYPNGVPAAISAAEVKQGQVLFCSAYATSDLTIEILKPVF